MGGPGVDRAQPPEGCPPLLRTLVPLSALGRGAPPSATVPAPTGRGQPRGPPPRAGQEAGGPGSLTERMVSWGISEQEGHPGLGGAWPTAGQHIPPTADTGQSKGFDDKRDHGLWLSLCLFSGKIRKKPECSSLLSSHPFLPAFNGCLCPQHQRKENCHMQMI